MERSRQVGRAGAVSSPEAVTSHPDCRVYHSSWAAVVVERLATGDMNTNLVKEPADSSENAGMVPHRAVDLAPTAKRRQPRSLS